MLSTTSRWLSPHFAMVIALLAMTLAGCQRNIYELELKPEKEKLDRKLTFWRASDNDEGHLVAPKADEVARIAKEYGQPFVGIEKHTFQREFTGRTPNDIGGEGYYLHWPTPLGELTVYAEEFRGDGDLVAEFTRRQRGIDRFVDHLLAWLKSEFAKEQKFDDVAKLIDQDLRTDLRNAAAWVWAYGVTASNEPLPIAHVMARLEMFLARRGYVAPQDLPAWRRALDDLRRDDPARLLVLIQRVAATKLGHPADQPPPDWLAWMVDGPRLNRSFQAYLTTSPEYRDLVAQYEKRKNEPNQRVPGPFDAQAQIVFETLVPDLHLVPDDRLRVKLKTGVKPIATNGQWLPETGEVTWSTEILPRGLDDRQSPRLVFAVWGEPNRDAQMKHFGKLLLDGQQLADFCFWYRGLTPDESARWDKFVAGLAPGDDLAAKLAAFRLSDAPEPEGAGAASLLDTPRRLLLPK